MPHDQRGIAERPRRGDQQHHVGHQRVANSSEARHYDDHHADERDQAAPEHRRFAGAHFVVFHDRQAGQADFHIRMPRGGVGDQLAQGLDRFGAASQLILAHGDSQQHKPQSAFFGHQIFGAQFAERRNCRRHARPGRLIMRRRLETGRQAVGQMFQLAQGLVQDRFPALRPRRLAASASGRRFACRPANATTRRR